MNNVLGASGLLLIEHTDSVSTRSFFEEDKEEAVIRTEQRVRVAFLCRLAVENLAEGNKIYVIKSGQGR